VICNKALKSNKKFLLELLSLIVLILVPFIYFQNNIFVITSPSMVPTLNVGDLVISGNKIPEDIRVGEKDGDIVILRGPQYFYENGFDPIFWNYLENNTPIIHRAIDRKKVGNQWYFLTKGDNNKFPDGSSKFLIKSHDYLLIEYDNLKAIYVPETEIIGVVIFRIPYIGYIKIFFPIIMALLIGTICSYLILKKLDYTIKIVKTSSINEEK